MAQTVKNLLAVRETRKAHQHLLSSINRRGYSVNRNENYDLPEPLIMNIIKKKKDRVPVLEEFTVVASSFAFLL